MNMENGLNHLANAFKNVAYQLRNIGNTFAIVFAKGFNNSQTLIKIDVPHLTKYHCTSCGCSLVVTGHDENFIFYLCLGCGKIHKARKNKVLGRF